MAGIKKNTKGTFIVDLGIYLDTDTASLSHLNAVAGALRRAEYKDTLTMSIIQRAINQRRMENAGPTTAQ